MQTSLLERTTNALRMPLNQSRIKKKKSKKSENMTADIIAMMRKIYCILLIVDLATWALVWARDRLRAFHRTIHSFVLCNHWGLDLAEGKVRGYRGNSSSRGGRRLISRMVSMAKCSSDRE